MIGSLFKGVVLLKRKILVSALILSLTFVISIFSISRANAQETQSPSIFQYQPDDVVVTLMRECSPEPANGVLHDILSYIFHVKAVVPNDQVYYLNFEFHDYDFDCWYFAHNPKADEWQCQGQTFDFSHLSSTHEAYAPISDRPWWRALYDENGNFDESYGFYIYDRARMTIRDSSMNIVDSVEFDNILFPRDGLFHDFKYSERASQANEWRQAGLIGKPVYSLAVDPSNPNIIFAGTNEGKGIYKTSDGGNNWTLIPFDLPISYTDSIKWAITIDPKNPGIIYVGHSTLGIIKTTDGGQSWQQENTGLSSLSIKSLAVDPINSNVLFAGSSQAGIFKSINAADSWTTKNSGLSELDMGYFDIDSIAIDPHNPNTVYAGLQHSAYHFTTLGVPIYKTIDGGNTWSPKENGIPKQNWGMPGGDDAYSLILDPTDSQSLYALMDIGVLKTTDSAESWQYISSGLPEIRAHVNGAYGLVIDPNNPLALYVQVLHYGSDPFQSRQATSEIFNTINGGSIWNSTGFSWEYGQTGPYIINVAIIPSLLPATIYAGSTNGVWKFGVNLTTSPNQPPIATAGLDQTAYVGDTVNFDGSQSYDQDGSIVKYEWDFGDGTTGTGDNVTHKYNSAGSYTTTLKVTDDDGATTTDTISIRILSSNPNWQKLNAPFSDWAFGGPQCVAVDPSNSQIIYVGVGWDATNPKMVSNPSGQKVGRNVHNGGVYRSNDGGATWAEKNGDWRRKPNIGSIVINPNSPNIVYAAATSGEGIFKSTDYGDHWSSINRGLPKSWKWFGAYPGIMAMAISTSDPSTIYAGSGNPNNPGIFKTTNGGDSWVDISPDISPRIDYFPRTVQVKSIAVDNNSSSIVYASLEIDGKGYIGESTNGGTSWTGFSQDSNEIVVGPRDPGLVFPNESPIYAGTWDGKFVVLAGAESDYGVITETKISDYPITALAVSSLRPQWIFAGTGPSVKTGKGGGSGIFHSRDRGLSWQQMNEGLPKEKDGNYPPIIDMALGASYPLRIFAITEKAIYRNDLR